ncbi:MAG: hypothetical protein ABFQ62_04465 [Patescibacteria group bacterium]
MLKKFCKLSVALFLLFLTTHYLLPITQISAQTQEWSQIQQEFGSSREYGCVYEHDGVADVATIRGIECIIANILTVAVTIIGLGGFVMMIFGAFKYQISGGNSKGAESARNIITYAVIGLILALSSYFILNILAEFTGISLITRFEIPQINP